MNEPRVTTPISHALRRLGVALFFMCMPPALFAAAGDLDCRFGLGGVIVHDFGSIEAAYDAQLTSDGRMVTLGFGAGSLRLSRFLANGQLDSTFGTNGTVLHTITGLQSGYSLAIDSLDRIIVGGTILLASNDDEALVARFNPDGTVDATFGSGMGWTSFDLTAATANAGDEYAGKVVVDANDRPLIGGSPDPNGSILNPSNRNMTVARLTTSGTLDTTFDGDGIAVIASSPGMTDDSLFSMAIDPMGRIVAIGVAKTYTPRDTIVVRWTPDGALDSSFDGDGVLVLDTSEDGSDDIGRDIGFSSTGAIVGLSTSPAPTLFRLTEVGALDTAFAGDGITQRSFLGTQDVTDGLQVQSDDKILVTGWPVTNGFSFHIAVMRFTAAGVLDTSWNSPDGVSSTIVGFNERVYASILRPDQSLVVLGGLNNDRDMVMARYLNDGHSNGPTTTTQLIDHLPDPSLVGQQVLVNYAVTAAAGIATGTVTVSDGLSSCSGSVAAGSCSLAMFVAGARTLTASYRGDGTVCASSDSQAHAVVVPTRGVFTAFNPSNSVVGQSVQVGVTVTPFNVGGVGPVTGSVTIDDGAGASCVGALLNGSTACSLIPSVAGTRTWTATYTGEGIFVTSQVESTRAVSPALTTTTISADTPDPSVAGIPVQVDINVTAQAPGSGTPTGTVNIDDGAGANCQLILSAGSGSCQLTPTLPGIRDLTANYLGDGNYALSFATEAHQTTGQDFGDAPSPYPVVLADDGPRHSFSDLFLGASVDVEANGQPSANASGDDLAGIDDEDGVSFGGPLLPGEMVEVTVVATQSGTVDAWLDYAGDGSWAQPSDRIINNLAVVSGPNTVTITIPSDAVVGVTFARFRLSSTGVSAPTGAAADGEVEDYQTTISLAAMELIYTATPAQIPETGGTIQFSVLVDNSGDLPFELTTLNSTSFGSLDGLGTCALPQTVAAAGSYACSFQQTISGPPGPQTDALAVAATVGSLIISDSTEANYSFSDELPQLTLSASADPVSVREPGATVSFTVVLNNPGLEAVTVSTLADDQIGSLADVGDCVLPQLLAPAAVYQCSYSAEVLGADGDRVRHALNASAADDESNNVGASDTVQVLITDGLGPRVVELAASGAAINPCATVRTVTDGFALRFSEPVLQGQQLSSYVIVSAGDDVDFSTVSCSGVAGDDRIQVITGAISDGDPSTLTINLQLDQVLPTGLTRVIVCPTVTDLAGNALDGNGDGSTGDAYVNTFRADPSNLLSNGDFDRCPVTLSPWLPITMLPNAINPSEIVDADGSTLSGSAQITSSADEMNALAQCVALPVGQSGLALKLRARLDAVGTATAEIALGCDYFDLAACAGPSTGGQMDANALPDLSGEWSDYLFALQAPTSAVSALCSAVVTADTPGQFTFDAYIDGLSLSVDTLFGDGFEISSVNGQSSSAD